MKKVIIVLMTIMFIFSINNGVQAKTVDSQDIKLINQFCRKQYGEKKITILKPSRKTDKILSNRKNKNRVYVEKLNVNCMGGKNGKSKRGYVKLLKPHKRGGKVKVYLVYCPYNNCFDGVDAVVSEGRVR